MAIVKELTTKVPEKNIPLDLINRGEYQPRQYFDPVGLKELATSIKQQGVLQPLIVRPKAKGRYEIIAGERRWRAAQLAELQEVPCKVVVCNDEQALQIAIVENKSRANLSAIEEAQGIQRLIDEFNYTQDEAADCLGMQRPTVTNLLRLLALHKDVKTLIIKHELTESHGKILLTLPLEKQYAYAREAIVKSWSTRELDHVIKMDQKKKLSQTLSKSSGADIEQLERKLSDYLGAAVKIQSIGKAKGFMKISYNSFEELDGILERIGWIDEDVF